MAGVAARAPAGVTDLSDELEQLWFSFDLDAVVDGPVNPTVISDSQAVELDPSTGLYAGIRGLSPGSGSDVRIDIDGFDFALDAYSVDVTETLDLILGPVTTLRPGEIWTRTGSLLFDPASAGLPDDINVDALARDPATGDLLLSFDRFVLRFIPIRGELVPYISPSHVVRWDGAVLNGYFDGDRIPRELNLDALHVLDDGRMLMSFDTPGRIDGLGFLDNDALLYDPVSDAFESVYRFGTVDSSRPPADVNALSGVRRIDGGTLRFDRSLFEIPEDFGTVTLTIRREGAAEGASTVRVQTVAGTATPGTDFTPVDVTRSWADGETTPRTVEIPILNDGTDEPSEQFRVTMTVTDGAATVGTPGSVTLRIFDDETVLFADGFEERP